MIFNGRNVWLSVRTFAVYGTVTIWLTSFALATAWIVREQLHPIACVYSLFAVPVLTLMGTLVGAFCGFVAGCLSRRPPLSELELARAGRGMMQRALVVTSAGTTIVVAVAMVWLTFENLPVTRLKWLGGVVDRRSGVVTFPMGQLKSEDFPAVVQCLNRIDNWYLLILGGTSVTGEDLRHLQGISQRFILSVSLTQLDEKGLAHLAEVKTLEGLLLDEADLPPGSLERLKQALPNIEYVHLTP